MSIERHDVLMVGVPAFGHVSPETTRLYTHFNLTDSKQRMESLEIRF